MSFTTKFTFDDATHFTFDSDLIEVSGGTIRLLDLGGATYSTANPSVTTQFRFMATDFNSFAETTSVSGSDAVKYILKINGVNYWYNATSTDWEESDGTYSQSNTGSVINTNATTLKADIGLTGFFYVDVTAFLHSDDGSTRPTLTDLTVGTDFVELSPTAISECVVTAYLRDLLGDVPTLTASQPATLYVKNNRTFMHGETLVVPFTKSAAFNSSGVASLSVIETATPGEKVEWGVSYFDGNSRKFVYFEPAEIPNEASAALSSIASVRTNDVG